MSPKQMTEMLNLVSKEEILEMEEKVEKALGQTKKAAEHVVATAIKAGFPATDELPSISIEQIPVKESEKSVSTTKEESSDEETKKKNRSSNP